MLLPLLSLLCATACASACVRSNSTAGWVFNTDKGHAFSCASSAGGVNDLGTAPTMCAGDVTSCKIPMHDFVSLDYDFDISGCNGIWAAPLWMTPDKWQWGAGSGEIDSLEFCSRDSVHLNFAGGGHQVKTPLSIDSSSGHVTVRKDDAGIVTISTCSKAEAEAEAAASPGQQGAHQCPAPSYKDCASCTAGGNAYGCWCNEGTTPPNIYGSGGCRSGGDCMWTLVSDVWNGVSGDAGYAGCMTAVPAIGLAKGKPNLKSKCALSVERLVLRGGGPNGSLNFGPGSPAACAALTTPKH